LGALERFGVQICAVSFAGGELVGGEFVGQPKPDSIGWKQESGGIRRNPYESE